MKRVNMHVIKCMTEIQGNEICMSDEMSCQESISVKHITPKQWFKTTAISPAHSLAIWAGLREACLQSPQGPGKDRLYRVASHSYWGPVLAGSWQGYRPQPGHDAPVFPVGYHTPADKTELTYGSTSGQCPTRARAKVEIFSLWF